MDTSSTEQPVSSAEQEISITLREQVLIVRNDAGEIIPTNSEPPDENAQSRE